MGYERDEAMRQQEATEEMIRMREPRRQTAHPDQLYDIQSALTAAHARIKEVEAERDELARQVFTGATTDIDKEKTRPETWRDRAEHNQAVFIMAKRRAERAEAERDKATARIATLERALDGVIEAMEPVVRLTAR